MKVEYREYYQLDFLEMGNSLHKYFFDFFQEIYGNRLTDTKMFKHPFIPDFFSDEEQKTYFYIRFNTANIGEEIESLSRHHEKSSTRIIIIVLEEAEGLKKEDLHMGENILLISGEAIDFLKKKISEEKYNSQFLSYCRRIFDRTSNLLKIEDLEKIINEYKIPVVVTHLHSINPFKYSYDDLIKLNDEEIDRIFNTASELNSAFQKEYFKRNPDIFWLVIAKQPGHIVAAGTIENEPFEGDLEKMARKYEIPVFTYSREKIFEEVDTSWSSKSDSEDYYPTVLLSFGSNEERQRLNADFDTGSSHSFLSYEVIIGMGILKRKPLIQANSNVMWGQRYSYYRKKLECKLLGISSEKEIELKCELVKNWEKSPQASIYNRDALIGRNLLLDNEVTLILDGKNKKTDILI